MAGDRGRKAFAARSIPDEPDPVDGSVTSPESASKALDNSSVPPSPAPQPGSAVPLASGPPTPGPQLTLDEHAPDDEPLCDVLSREEFGQELAELLLAKAPTLTGQQILQVRESILECARKHGWIDI